jgi:hypothetical protein
VIPPSTKPLDTAFIDRDLISITVDPATEDLVLAFALSPDAMNFQLGNKLLSNPTEKLPTGLAVIIRGITYDDETVFIR